MPDNGKSEQSELEKLFAQAEPPAEVQSEMPKISTHYECSKCGKKCYKQCPECLGPFCEAHASPINPECCNICLDRNVRVDIVPLTNSEGHEVPGRRLQVDPQQFATFSKKISELSDAEFDKYLTAYEETVNRNVKMVASQQVRLATLHDEKGERKRLEQRKLRAVKLAKPAAAKAAAPKPPSFAELTADPLFAQKLQEELAKIFAKHQQQDKTKQ
jgi:hypothetical protein